MCELTTASVLPFANEPFSVLDTPNKSPTFSHHCPHPTVSKYISTGKGQIQMCVLLVDVRLRNHFIFTPSAPHPSNISPSIRMRCAKYVLCR
jgi:hypothetical protein